MARGLRFARRVTVLRAGAAVDDGLQSRPGAEVEAFSRMADRRDVSDGERFRSGEVMAELGTRYTLRADSLTRTITAKDRLREGGVVLQILGVKEAGAGALIEVTCARRSDQ
jgi:head-tail adaptor